MINPAWRSRVRDTGSIAAFVLVIALLGVLSVRYTINLDWTVSGRNTLRPASADLLDRLTDPITVAAYATEDELFRRQIESLLRRYQRHKPDFSYRFVDPDRAPDEVRDKGISVNGELLIRYQGREEHVTAHSEDQITNALARLSEAGERFVVGIVGHGERELDGQRNHDLGSFGAQLSRRGYRTQNLNLEDTRAIPDNTAVLVLADARTTMLPAVLNAIRDFVSNGGNFLWLSEADAKPDMSVLAELLGIEFVPGTILDPSVVQFGVDDPTFTLVTRYPEHPLTRDFRLVTLFPRARGLRVTAPEGWSAEALLTSHSESWSETGALAGDVTYDPDSDTSGPLNIGYAWSRERPSPGAGQQRVVVIGDGDFLSNAFAGNGGNLEFGLNIMDWLSGNETLLNIAPLSAPDLKLELSTTEQAVIAIGWLFAAPLALLGIGVGVWLRRR